MRRGAPLAAVLVGLALAPGGSTARAPLTPPQGYFRPVVVDGMTFPVARSSWRGVIEFRRDWHDPRFRLVGGRWRPVGRHEGNDILAEEGTPVHAMAAGTVEAVGWTFYSGTRVGVRGIDGRYYLYAHLSEVAPAIAGGRTVDAGAVLGRVGNTGYGDPGHRGEFPPHLHLGIQEGETWVDPYPEVRRLYRESARVTRRGERRLARLAAAGDAERFEALVRSLYAEGTE